MSDGKLFMRFITTHGVRDEPVTDTGLVEVAANRKARTIRAEIKIPETAAYFAIALLEGSDEYYRCDLRLLGGPIALSKDMTLIVTLRMSITWSGAVCEGRC